MEFECDTLLLSIGLVPYVSLLGNIDCKMSSTKGAEVNESLETSIDGVFACGNCLHVHDVVDFVTDEGREAGKNAAAFIKEKNKKVFSIKVVPGNNISYVVPQNISDKSKENITFKFRVRKPLKDVKVIFKSGNHAIKSVVKQALIPSEMVMIKLNKNEITNIENDLVVEISE